MNTFIPMLRSPKSVSYFLENENRNIVTIMGRNGTHKKYELSDETKYFQHMRKDETHSSEGILWRI